MIDLRSDTITRPTQGMIDAITEALNDPKLADVSIELDPVVDRLEKKAAAMTGKEAALFVSSGTMSNLTAVLTHKTGGTEIIIDSHAHIGRTECGGISVVAGLHSVHIPSQKGEMDLYTLQKAITEALRRPGLPPALICLESSHNHSGGYVPSLAYMREVHAMAKNVGTPVHLDGARLFNAAVALNVPASDIAAHCDSLSFCVSKGLSAPYGALLAGSGDFIKRARAFRFVLGGGMRQIAGMAAAALVALETMPGRLGEDHRRMKMLWKKVRDLAPGLAPEDEPQTNIMFLRPKRASAQRWVEVLAENGLRCFAVGPEKVRLVTHRHIDDAAIDGAFAAIAATRAILGEA